MTCLEDFFGVKGFTKEFLHVSSSQEDGGHHSHQHPGEDEAKSNTAVEKDRQALRHSRNYRTIRYEAAFEWVDCKWPEVATVRSFMGS